MHRRLLIAFIPFLLLSTQACRSTKAQWVIRHHDAPAHEIAQGKGQVHLFLNKQSGAHDVALSVLHLAPGASVPEHVHSSSSEALYIEKGQVEMTIAGHIVRAGPGDAVYIPAGTPHSARVLGQVEALRAIQVYVGAGPEERFRKGKKI